MKKSYDLGSGSTGDLTEFKEELMNNTLYAILTNGLEWSFLQYIHNFDTVTTRVIHYEKIRMTDFFKSVQAIVNVTINLCCDLIFKEYTLASTTQRLNHEEDFLNRR